MSARTKAPRPHVVECGGCGDIHSPDDLFDGECSQCIAENAGDELEALESLDAVLDDTVLELAA